MKKSGGKGSFNVAEVLLNENVALRGDKVAIYCGEERITYKTLNDNVNRFANMLKALGVKPTERVMILLPDSPMFVYAFLGSIKYGAWPVPVNTMLTEKDYEYMLENSEARVLVTESQSNAVGAKTSHLCYRLFADKGLESLMAASPEAETCQTKADDIAFWLYSSGSTGRPKGVPHRHIDMIHVGDHFGKQVLKVQDTDTVFSVSKLFFAYGLGNGLHIPFRCGASTVLLSAPPSPESVIETVSTYKPTIFFGVPTQYNSVLKRMKNSDCFASVRVCTSAGEALPPEIFNRWKAATGLEILDGIGSTEALHIFISNTPGDVRPGTSGRVVPGYEARIVDDAGIEVPPGEAGHLIIRGQSITPGYWNRPDENAEKVLPDGWFKTGDMYTQTDGYFTYQGRGDDMLKVGGIWVSPVEIENVLLEHEAVHEAAVVGHDVEGLSKPFGYVALNDQFKDQPGDDLNEELVRFVSDRLPKFKWLRDIYFVDELPKTATGKIQRFKLRKAS
ncbi:MAG: Benzoate--CoA ligase [Syntrophorhabdus sp. PtaU1.Bin153]|nr:MAG: Benzoate--CoA ligase [Syntrophorhabdus sp. PtaU1.Bin153]